MDKRQTEDPRVKGDLAELKVIEWCLQKGYTPLTPFGGANNCRYDVAYDDGQSIKRVQVKCRPLYEDTLSISLIKQQNERPGKVLKSEENEFDKFFVNFPDTNQ